MEELGVIAKVEEPTEWRAGMVVVPKPNGKVRICVDLTRLNESVRAPITRSRPDTSTTSRSEDLLEVGCQLWILADPPCRSIYIAHDLYHTI